MKNQIFNFFKLLVRSYLFIIVVALVAGLFFSERTILLAPFATLFLQIIFFFTSLKLDSRNLVKEARNVKMLIVANVFMLIVLPAVVFLIADAFIPSMAVALLLLSAMPTGMTAPLLAEVIDGKPGTALLLTITTSLLAPFTIPLMIGVFASASVSVSAMAMFWSLVKVILIPFVLARLARRYFHKKLEFTYFTFKPLSLILLGLLIAGVTAKQSSVIISGLGSTIVVQLVVLTIFISILLVLGHFLAFWRPLKDRVTVSVCVTFMNFTLAIFLAGSFFSDPKISLATVLVIFPWALLLIPYKRIIASRFNM